MGQIKALHNVHKDSLKRPQEAEVIERNILLLAGHIEGIILKATVK